MNLILSDELEKSFRKAVYERFGMKRGNMMIAVEQAIKEWVDKAEVSKEQSEVTNSAEPERN